ncbi:MAG: hypothetical protein N2250_06115 [Pseudothermotoga sp.]|nr:hypothetical protein [Pseudothermotoga sp.]
MSSKGGVILLDFEGTYLFQEKLSEKATRIDLSHLKSTKYMCNRVTFGRVRNVVEKRPKLAFLSDSAYHHFTYLFLSMIDVPFELVVLDNHRDDMNRHSAFLTCDSWIKNSERLKNLRKVHIIKKKDELPDRVEHPVYLSIDKDVISDQFIELGWDQGQIDLDEFFTMVQHVCERFELLGADVCGEPRDPFQLNVSEQINLRLLEIILNSIERTFIETAFKLSSEALLSQRNSS